MAQTFNPEVRWTDRSSCVIVTICVPDAVAVKDDKAETKQDEKTEGPVTLTSTGLTYTGTQTTTQKKYHLELEFFTDIDVGQSTIIHTQQNTRIRLQKKEDGREEWSRLTKKKMTYHNIHVDWADYTPEDEEPADEFPMGGGMGGMPGMGGMGGDFLNFNELGGGGAGGMPDMSSIGLEAMPEMSSLGNPENKDESHEAEEEEMPDLVEKKA